MHIRCLAAPAVFVSFVLAAAAASAADPGLCKSCHRADSRIAPDLAGRPAEDILAAIRAFRDGGRHHPNMESFSKSLSDDDIAGLAAYFSAQASAVGTVASPPVPARKE